MRSRRMQGPHRSDRKRRPQADVPQEQSRRVARMGGQPVYGSHEEDILDDEYDYSYDVSTQVPITKTKRGKHAPRKQRELFK